MAGVAAALQQDRSGSVGTVFDRHSTVLIGDSPADVETARKGGARVIAVAAGGTSASALADADVVLDDLTDIDALTKAIRAQ
ncbi:HAD family hydrolase [Nocardia sp. NPDC051570]|uniref:HAD family hydrolase n=1 Tax=Nocardia sp. NPDC051570 TaxID=3364324 RepID=UPI0037A816A1